MVDQALEILRERYPWPDIDGCTPWDYTLGGHGRALVDNLIREQKPKILLEIGCFLCASSKRWLSLDPDMIVIGIDPWDEGLVEQCKRYVDRPALTRAYPNVEDHYRFVADVERQSPFRTALSNLKGFEKRFIPMRGYSPERLYELAELGITPDMVYIDADKKAEDLEVAFKLWPKIQITGDDWHWSRTKGYPMRQVVNGFAATHGFKVTAEHATWFLSR